MNDEDFIIISSDEEIDKTSISKDLKASGDSKDTEKKINHEADSCKKENFIFKSDKQETGHSSQMPAADEESNKSSKNMKLDISIGAQGSQNSNEMLNKKKITQNAKVETEIEMDVDKNNENDNKMSTTFKEFLQLVLSIEVEEDDKSKLLKKITKYHNLADPDYVKSDTFKILLENGMSKLNQKQSLLYPIIKEVLDCLLSKRVLVDYRKTQKKKPPGTGDSSGEMNHDDYFDSDEKNYKKVKKLTKALRKLGKIIKELEEAEVDLNDEEDSNYIKMQRYRERFCQVYKKLCTYTNQTANAKRICTRKISFNGTNNLQLDRAIESWLNKTMEFPDYASVFKFLTESNGSLQLGFSKEKLKKMAVDVFGKIGNSLQLRRKYDLWESFNSFLQNEIDPSTSDEALRQRLNSNFEVASRKEKEILNYYADLQTQNKLEPAEVPDEVANCSPVESGDEDENEIEEVEKALTSKISLEVEESDSEENDEKEVDLPIPRDDEIGNGDSSKSNAPQESECVSNSFDKYANDKSRSLDAVNPRVADVVKECSCEDVENCDKKGMRAKRSPDVEITHCVKKSKLTESEIRENDSDCEIVVVLSDEETNFKSEKNDSFQIRNVYQINYTFINNNFNHNALQKLQDRVLKRKTNSQIFKTVKNQRKFLPFSDLTNIKHITNKYARIKGGMEKRKVHETIRIHPFERSRFKYSKFILPDKMSNHCALQNESGSKNVKNKNKSDQVEEKDSRKKNPNDETITPSNNGGSGGGNGKDNNDDNGNKKPWDRDKQLDGNQEVEDEEEDDEDDKEASQMDQSDSTPAETNGADMESNENREASSDDLFVSPQQLVCITIDPPQPKRKSASTKGRRISSNTTRAQKNGGLPSTSRLVSSRHSCKPHAGSVKTSRGRPRQSYPLNVSQMEMFGSPQRRQPTSVKTAKTDEEIVKNFLQHSPSSISITSPRKLLIDNKPSPSILQAIQTLSRLKSITATVVKASCPEREEDITVIGESPKKTRGSATSTQKSRRTQSFVLPKIVTVQGNVSGFENMNSDDPVNNSPKKSSCPGRRKIQRSQSHGSPDNPGNNSDNPRRKNNPTKQQSSKKSVEYVVLD